MFATKNNEKRNWTNETSSRDIGTHHLNANDNKKDKYTKDIYAQGPRFPKLE